MKIIVLALSTLLLLSACSHSIHLVHVSDFAPSYKALSQGRIVQSKAEQFVVMGFVQDTNYVESAYQQLQATCPGAEIQGITTQFSTSHGFFSWTNFVEMQGLCVQKSQN